MTEEQKAEELWKKADKYVVTTGNNDCTIDAYIAGYHECQKEHKWHYPSKGEYPKDENKICLLYLGNMFNPITGWYKNGYWCFEDDRNDYIWQDKVIAWKEIVLPELKESK